MKMPKTKKAKRDSSLVKFLLKHNKEQSRKFSDTGMALLRRQYRAKHPTEIAALKCMDGRLHMPLMTGTPLGIIQPFRNIGGKFNFGWPFFGLLLKEWVEYAVSRGRDSIVLVTYHFSKSDPHLGCKGFNYDTQAARKAAAELVGQIERVFGSSHAAVYPVLIGIETDEDALVLHGKQGGTLNLSKFVVGGKNGIDREFLEKEIMRLYPDMKLRMRDDLLPLLLGNLSRIREARRSSKSGNGMDHCEQILGVGRGFDWLHLRNKALIVGPFSFDLVDPIAKAAGILMENLHKGRIPKKDGVVLISSAVYREDVSIEHRLAEEKARAVADLAYETIKAHVPDLLPYLSVLVGTVDLNTRRFNRIVL